MTYIPRLIEQRMRSTLKRNKSILLLGPRQTGKTTLLHKLSPDRYISLANLETRIEYERDLGRLTREIESFAGKLPHCPIVAIDEFQKIPILTDAIQDLVDRGLAQFILTGSSARKLRKTHSLNLLPGRVIPFHLDALAIKEIPDDKLVLNDLLLFGSLPNVVLEEVSEFREENIDAYVSIFLEEEIRAEAAVRNVGMFAHFLLLAAIESGNPVNFEKISQDIGVSRTTIASYYQILVDCLIAEQIEPLSDSCTRKRLVKTPKYLLFDVGVRRAAAKMGTKLPKESMGHLFEEFVGLELLKILHCYSPRSKLHFWRDLNGPEIDWVVEHDGQYLPIEVKWTTNPALSHSRHLKIFLNEYPSKRGFIVCQIPFRQKITEQIEAVSWKEIPDILEEFLQS